MEKLTKDFPGEEAPEDEHIDKSDLTEKEGQEIQEGFFHVFSRWLNGGVDVSWSDAKHKESHQDSSPPS